ncbi:hypothetical protein PF006_g24980 [Phytophthora fragariae]|uniref:Amine oxidase n=1 Tax=Phytophthora fragariae TaxID=53985 RepID=A0A6A3R6S9_9STRA|nr:hypothetical protein PF006_g24980 [Phytophthora fragariae]
MIKEAELDPKADGQIPILAQDYLDGDSICKGEPVYVSALVKRGTTDVDMVRGQHLLSGVFGYKSEEATTGSARRASSRTRTCTSYLGDPRRLHGREGLTLHDISSSDRGRKRKILNRASVTAEMVGCDCLGSIHYLDATVVDDFYEPFVIKNATFMYEEDFGTLWKHTDVLASPPTGTMRRQHRFVVSFFVTVGSYRYGFYWYFYLDGRDELDCGHGYQMDCGHDYQMDD